MITIKQTEDFDIDELPGRGEYGWHYDDGSGEGYGTGDGEGGAYGDMIDDWCGWGQEIK